MEIKRYRLNNRIKRRPGQPGLIFGVVLLLTSVFGYSFMAINKDLPPLEPVLASVQKAEAHPVNITWPEGQGVIGTVSDGVLAASAENQEVKPIASMSKLVTALAVLDRQPMGLGEPGKVYTITSRDVTLYRDYIAKLGSIMPVRVGQQLTQYQALQGLLLPSANNIADTLVLNEFGTMEQYLDYANQMLNSYGLHNTTVADASGFSPNTVSTPSDMFEIGRRALAHPVIAEIVAQREAFIPDTGLIRNTNQLLADSSVIGLKTGTTDEAGSCLLFAFEHTLDDGSTETVVAVVMGVPTWSQLYREVRALIDDTRQGFGPIQILDEGVVMGEYRSPWGISTQFITSRPLTVHDWLGLERSADIDARPLHAPADKNTQVGTASTDTIEVPLILRDNIPAPSVWWRLVNYW